MGCAAVFGEPPARLRGRTVDLESVWETAGPLRTRLLATGDPERMLDLVERHLEVVVTDDGPTVDVRSPADIDDHLAAWIGQAYDAAGR